MTYSKLIFLVLKPLFGAFLLKPNFSTLLSDLISEPICTFSLHFRIKFKRIVFVMPKQFTDQIQNAVFLKVPAILPFKIIINKIKIFRHVSKTIYNW
ncbi:hypothetical protein C4F50_16930 [Flavobacterium sp. KB82]|uniref:Secreted protein n=1 Tax=Flavobacterium hungaricum TaxID=2082725 RepID=A0ABR9TPQ0_9FLAO|nr:hypothetical protein [Flavobacterium hungaricum]